MATAESKAHRRKEQESRATDASPGDSTHRSSRSRRSTRQLDFFQAMSDFRQMFPTLEDDVIEAVLRANDGAVDATIDQLLTMTIDETNFEAEKEEAVMLQAICPDYNVQDTVTTTEDSPPSYSEAMRSQTQTDTAQSIWTTPIGQPLIPARTLHLDIDPMTLSNTEPKGAAASLSPQGLFPGSGSEFGPGRDAMTDSFSFGGHRSSLNQNTPRKKEYRNWNPPLLGNLPDDFLRLIPPDVQKPNNSKTDLERTSYLSTTPVNVLSLTDVKPKTHKSRSKSEKVSRSSSTKEVREKESRVKDKKSKSDKMSRSFSVVEESSPQAHGHKVSRSQSARNKDKGSRQDTGMSTHHSVIIETHDFSKNMLQERMKENERRRKKTSVELDPELSQYLEDERLAIALQNSEFLQELRGNEDFIKTLEKDGVSASALDPAPKGFVLGQRPPDDFHEGYGDDSDKTLGAFPFSQPLPKDNDAEIRRQLSGMGKASKKQLATLAKKFFRRKKKSSKQILGEKLAPSMINLLEDEDEEEEDDDLHIDQRYNSSPPEIEPLPSTLIGVPTHRTVQRPAYKPDGVTTYFDNKNVDIV